MAYLSRSPAAQRLGRSKLPDGLSIVHDPESRDTAYVHTEIFQKRVYLRHGVDLHDDAQILDVGGHIGLFSLFALKRYARVRTYVLEPMPRTFRALTMNLEAHRPEGSAIRLLNCGASDRSKLATFSYYPGIPGHSTMFPEQKAELHRIVEQRLRERPWAHHKLLGLLCLLLYPLRRSLVRYAVSWLFRAEAVSCPLRPLSDVIDEERMERIDLLKIDVEDAELDVLRGIRADHWPRIRQVVVETCDYQGRRAAVQALLRSHGFRCVSEQDPVDQEIAGYVVFAVRESEAAGARGSSAVA